jgi:magnesium transporter
MKTYYINNKGLKQSDEWKENCWINIENPTNEEKAYLLDEIKIPEAFYNDIEDIDERPRIEVENDWTFIILRIPYKNNDLRNPYTTIPLGVIFKDDIFVTISFYSTDLIADFIKYSNKKGIEKNDNFDFIFRILLSSSVWFLKYLKQINLEIKNAENTLEKSIRNEDLQTLFSIEKSLVYFTTSLRSNDILLHRLKNLKTVKYNIDEELIEDVEIELRQAIETANIFSDILTGMMDAYASVISNNLNIVMKRLTSISIVLMIPTLIASLYGMNVPNALQNNPHGFIIVIFLSIIVAVVGIILFLKKKWF